MLVLLLLFENLDQYVPDAMKLRDNGMALCVPFEDKKVFGLLNFTAMKIPVARRKAYVKYIIALLPCDSSFDISIVQRLN